MGLIESLLIVYGGLLCINVALSLLLWATQRTPLHRGLFFVWASQVAAFLAQGGVAHASGLAIVYAFSSTYLANLAVAFLLARVVGLEVPWRLETALFALSCVLSGAAHLSNAPFWMVALPVCSAVALPLLLTATDTLRKRRKALTTTGWALTVTCLAFALHNLDFAFLRDKPEFAVTGFTIAILFAFALGTTAPAVVLERVAEERARAEELDRFKSKFFASITHELKTPLTMVLTSLELLLDGELGHISEPQRSTFQSMQRSGAKLLRLIGDLLDLSRLEESHIRLRIAEQDLAAYLRELVSETQMLVQRKGISLTFKSESDAQLVWCDLDRLERVFLNLLSNATKFTDAGGSVSIELSDQGEAVLVHVRDSGIGFPPELAERIFSRFFQTDMGKARRYGGTGIGLSLAKELVELHGGSIRAESPPGGGSTFEVRLLKDREHFKPEVLDRRSAAAAFTAGKRTGDRGVSDWRSGADAKFRLLEIDEVTEQRVVERDPDEQRRSHTVLVVEDTPDVIRMIRLSLHHDFRIFAATDGQQGLELARKHRPSIIVTDLMMPIMDGFELTKQVREDPQLSHIPVVMLTARTEVESRVAGLQTGVDAYLGKPFSSKELVNTVRSLVRNQERTADMVLSQKLDSIEAIAGGLAHEIGNPLNYVKNALTMVQRDMLLVTQSTRAGTGPRPEVDLDAVGRRAAKLFEVAESGVRRIAATVDLMMRYSRNGFSRVHQPFDVFAAARDVVEILLPSLGRSLEVVKRFEGYPMVDCVPEELNQVLSNLIQNAAEASPNDGTGRLEIVGWNEDEQLCLSVRDNGGGISPDNVNRVFNAFFTTKDTGAGMGLGLTIAQRVARALGGAITVQSQLGEGTIFTLRVPLAKRPRLKAVGAR